MVFSYMNFQLFIRRLRFFAKNKACMIFPKKENVRKFIAYRDYKQDF